MQNARAADISWGAGTDDWNTSGNWNPATTPGTSDIAIIDNGGTAQVTSSAAVQSVSLGSTAASSGSLQVTGSGSLDTTIAVGATANKIGSAAGSTGSLTVNGPSATWVYGGSVAIGRDGGSGTLVVTNGGVMTRASGSLLAVGLNGGSGTLAITNGGTATASSVDIGQSISIGAASTGVATVDGIGSVLVVNGLGVGFSNGANGTSGTLNISNHGRVTGLSVSFQIGYASTGSLNITGGGLLDGTLATNRAFLGQGGTGTATVDGVGSALLLGGTLVVGRIGSGNGTLNITNSGNVTVGGGAGTVTLGDTGGRGVLNIGAGGGAGVLNAATVDGSTGTATLNFNHTDASYFFTRDGTSGGGAIAITGSTALNHIGTGTTILTGANTYTGGTTVSAGTLRAGAADTFSASSAFTVASGATLELFSLNQTVGSLAGAGGVRLGSATLTVGGNDTSTTFSGVISGAGAGLTKVGAGTMTLSGANTYIGDTIVSAGTLRAGAAGTFSGSAFTVASGATLDLNGLNQTVSALDGAGSVTLGSATLTTGEGNSDRTFSGVISGGGSLTKAGVGTLTLSGANTYSGDTIISAGTLRAGAAGTFSGSAFTVAGGATLDLNNFNQAIGSLAGAGSATLGSASLTVGGNDSSTTFSGSISGGGGGLTKNGAGVLNLTGANTYTGATSVNAGTLSVNGSLASAVTVNSGGTLGGSGTINNTVSVASGGAFAPGNSIGTITVNGNVNFAPGSIYRVEVDAAGNADRVNATGAATLTGGTVDVQASAGRYQANTQYTIVNAAGGVTGRFNTVTSNLAFLTPTLTYGANNVFLALARNDISFASVATTPNQRATATVLEAASVGATGDMTAVVNAVTGLSAPEARAAYDSIGGASLVALRRAGMAFADGFGQQLNRRLGVVASGEAARQTTAFGSPLLLAANDWQSDWQVDGQRVAQAGMGAALDDAQRPERRDGRGFWMRGYGVDSDTDSDGNATATTLRGSGLSLGVDTEVREGLVLGVAAMGGNSRVVFSGSADVGRSRGSALGVYGSYVTGPWTFKGTAGLAWSVNHMDRNITVGAIQRTAASDFDSRSQLLYTEATHDLPQPGYLLQPLAALSYLRTETDSFTETSAGALNLQIAGQTTESIRTQLGAKTVHELRSLKLEPRLLWAHEFGDVNAPLSASLTGAPFAGSFRVAGAALDRDSLVLGLGVSGQLRKDVALVADGQVEGNWHQRSVAFFVGMRGVW